MARSKPKNRKRAAARAIRAAKRSKTLQFLPDQFESRRTVRRRRDKLIGDLRRGGSAEALALAEKLEDCDEHHPCNSGACPVCLREFRVRYLTGTDVSLYERAELQRLSIVPAGGRAHLGKLLEFDQKRFRNAIRQNLRRKGPLLAWVLVGIDVSLNLEPGSGPYWQIHLYVLTPIDSDGVDWRTVFPTDSRDPRPLQARGVRKRRDFPRVFSYLLKADFYRRSRYRARNGRMNTRAFSLKPSELVELSLFLDRYPIRTRLIAHRMRISEGRDRLHFHLADDGPR